jgi:hypothetical protein
MLAACLRRRLKSANAAIPIATSATGRATTTAPPMKARDIATSATAKAATTMVNPDMSTAYPRPGGANGRTYCPEGPNRLVSPSGSRPSRPT